MKIRVLYYSGGGSYHEAWLLEKSKDGTYCKVRPFWWPFTYWTYTENVKALN